MFHLQQFDRKHSAEVFISVLFPHMWTVRALRSQSLLLNIRTMINDSFQTFRLKQRVEPRCWQPAGESEPSQNPRCRPGVGPEHQQPHWDTVSLQDSDSWSWALQLILSAASCQSKNSRHRPAAVSWITEWFLICCHVLIRPEPLSSSGSGLLSAPTVRTKHGGAAWPLTSRFLFDFNINASS